jgi:hypothetical protein
MPTWVKVAIDAWTASADVTNGHVFRSVNRADRLAIDGLGEKVVWPLIKPYADAAIDIVLAATTGSVSLALNM